MQPLVQSTNETPKGPLTLRVYAGAAGAPCNGELYLDDGKSYAYQHGAYLRMKFSCEVTADGIRLHIGAHEGTYPAWWKEIRAEVYGLQSKQYHASVKGQERTTEQTAAYIGIEAEDNGKGLDIEVR